MGVVMATGTKPAGIEASYEPVDWHPAGLPVDPDELIAAVLDPSKRGELYPLFHQLRRVAPLHRNPPHLFHGGITVARFDHADTMFKNARIVNDPKVVDEAFVKGDGSFTDIMRTVLVWQEPEPHQRVRNLVKAAFTPRAMARWRPIAEQVAGELCDRMAAEGHADLVAQYNEELPFTVIARVLGVPDEDIPTIKAMSYDFARMAERELPEDMLRKGDAAARGLIGYFTDLVERRRSAPGDDLLTSLIAAEADGERLTHTELIANAILLMQAGHETTQDLLGSAQVALFRHPDQLRLLRDRPDLTRNATEEFLRYEPSVQLNHRIALDGATVDGVDIPKGDMVCIFLGAVNRDPERFPDPDRLDITRDVTHHLAFSFGAYYCLGAALARTEISVGIRTLLDRFPGLRPATDSFEWRATLALRGPQTIEATW